ncbi:MAG: sugar ABC transporter ATP-binding protein, partial [Chloroflexi bacterium]
HELVGLCDRVLVFSRGRVIAEGLKGAQLTEESVIGAFVGSGAQRSRGEEVKAALAATRSRPAALVSGLTSAGLPLLLLTTLMLAMGGYTASRSSTFLAFSNIQSLVLSTMPLALVAMAQLSALLVGGFDISVGSVMSLTVVTASFLAVDGKSAPLVIIGLVLCLGVGLAVGVFNGTLIRGLRLSPVVATIATLSILQGIALVLRATPGGSIDTGFQDRLGSTVGFLPVAFIGIVALAVAADVWLYRSRRGGLLAALAGLFLAAQVGVGDATVGSEFTLTSIAAAVLGGASLFGGRGSFVGAVLGALFLSLIVNIIPLLGLTTAIGQIATGSLTLLAIVLYSGRELWSRMATTLRAALPAAPVAQPEAAK